MAAALFPKYLFIKKIERAARASDIVGEWARKGRVIFYYNADWFELEAGCHAINFTTFRARFQELIPILCFRNKCNRFIVLFYRRVTFLRSFL